MRWTLSPHFTFRDSEAQRSKTTYVRFLWPLPVCLTKCHAASWPSLNAPFIVTLSHIHTHYAHKHVHMCMHSYTHTHTCTLMHSWLDCLSSLTIFCTSHETQHILPYTANKGMNMRPFYKLQGATPQGPQILMFEFAPVARIVSSA